VSDRAAETARRDAPFSVSSPDRTNDARMNPGPPGESLLACLLFPAASSPAIHQRLTSPHNTYI
jgi:hypothetical protein